MKDTERQTSLKTQKEERHEKHYPGTRKED